MPSRLEIEDSDSTGNNSLASSSGQRETSVAVSSTEDGENSLTSFEGLLLNGIPHSLDIESSASIEGNKQKNTTCKPLMLADLLEKKSDKKEPPPILNGVLGKELVENHLEKVLSNKEKEMINNLNKSESLNENPAQLGTKRPSTELPDAVEAKRPHLNGNASPESEVTEAPSSSAANLYSALAASVLEDEEETSQTSSIQVPSPIQQLQISQLATSSSIQTSTASLVSTTPQMLMQQQLIVATAPHRQIIVSQGQIPTGNQQVLISTGGGQFTIANKPAQFILHQSQQSGQYIVSGMVQPQTQTVLVAQTAQQQGTGAKTIIILQPQTNASSAQGQTQQKMMVTPQGQPVMVAQVARPLLQSSSVSTVPTPAASPSPAPAASLPIPSVGEANLHPPPLVAVSSSSLGNIVSRSQEFSKITSSTSINTQTISKPLSMPTLTPSVSQTKCSTFVTQTASKVPMQTQATQIMVAVGKTNNSHNESVSSIAGTSKTVDQAMFLCEWRGCMR